MGESQMHHASGRSQTQKAACCMFPLIGHSGKGKIVGTENRLGVARGWRVGKTLTTRRHKELFWSDEYFLYLDVMRVT